MKLTILMINIKYLIIPCALLIIGSLYINCSEDIFVSNIADTQKIEIIFYFKDNNNQLFQNIDNLKSWLEKQNKKLIFATNGGIYNANYTPHGLYIENGIILSKLDTLSGEGNFYIKPNGVFYIDKENNAYICKTEDFKYSKKIKYATQSGPILLIDGEINPCLKEDSESLYIRNGVGILPDNKVVFTISKKEINLYNLAKFFKDIGCKNALYLDGIISKMYYPEGNIEQLDGILVVIIAVISGI